MYLVPLAAGVVVAIAVSPIFILLIPIPFLSSTSYAVAAVDAKADSFGQLDRIKAIVERLAQERKVRAPMVTVAGISLGTIWTRKGTIIAFPSRLSQTLSDEATQALVIHEFEHVCDVKWMRLSRIQWVTSWRFMGAVMGAGLGVTLASNQLGWLILTAMAPTLSWLTAIAERLPKTAYRRGAEFEADTRAMGAGATAAVLMDSIKAWQRLYELNTKRLKYLPVRLLGFPDSLIFRNLSAQRISRLERMVAT
jgi:hypothetical protein